MTIVSSKQDKFCTRCETVDRFPCGQCRMCAKLRAKPSRDGSITPCKKCGSTVKTTQGQCRPCQYRSHTEWREVNKHKIAAWDRARKIDARQVPAWADRSVIREIYRLAIELNRHGVGKWHVDHVVPLKSEFVCGLHVESNLQIIPADDNLVKFNRYWPGMWGDA